MRLTLALLLWTTASTIGLRVAVQRGHRHVQAARHHASPLMMRANDEPSLLANPIKVIATVIAQADIVGVEAPRVPNSLRSRSRAKPAATTTTTTAAAPTTAAAAAGQTPVTVGGKTMLLPLWECSEGWSDEAARLPNTARREVDRDCVHPLLKLADGSELEPLLTSFLRLPSPLQLSLAAPLIIALAPLLLLLVAQRKAQWTIDVAASAAEHRAAFDDAWHEYRQEQRRTVRRLLDVRASGTRDPLLPAAGEPLTIAVTMATGQEGRAVVKALSAATDAFPNLTVRALVRDPSSAKALELAALPRVQTVRADSVDEASLSSALDGAHAAYLCTTLNNANAGTWSMGWDGGRYELEQGVAFAAAAAKSASLQQVVYGTAPARKWPAAYRVEPPIHYAAKWRVEEMLERAGVPLTSVRKCPYHENFTKLTKPVPRKGGEGGDGWWEPGTYHIKALSDAAFEYNMLGPGDIGAWALLAFSHPTELRGASLSIAADCLTGSAMAEGATKATAFGPGVAFEYKEQPRWLFEALAFVEPTFVYISGLQRWNSDGGQYDLTREDVEELRALHAGMTWEEHLREDGLEQFTATMAELLPDVVKQS